MQTALLQVSIENIEFEKKGHNYAAIDEKQYIKLLRFHSPILG